MGRGENKIKWFKHYTDSLDDPFIGSLLDEFGHLGYVAYFGLVEVIAKENGHEVTGKLSVSPVYLRRKLRTSQTKLREVYEYCQTNDRFLVNFSEKEWHFDFPKIAKIKDNYTKDLQASGKKPSKQKEVDKEVDKEKTIKGSPKRDKKEPKGFDRFYSIYPKKKSKGAARKAWGKINPDPTLQDRIIAKIEEGLKSKEWSNKEFIPYPATWLNAEGWEDEFTYVKGKTESQKKEEQIKELRRAVKTKKDKEGNRLPPAELKKAKELLKEYEEKI